MITKDVGLAPTEGITKLPKLDVKRYGVREGGHYRPQDLHEVQMMIDKSVQGDGSKARETLEMVGAQVPFLRLKEGYPADQLKALREGENVGPAKYGESLVKKFHKGAKTAKEHEAAQDKAYNVLQEKIDKKAVDPGSIGSDMLMNFKLLRKSQLSPKLPTKLFRWSIKSWIRLSRRDI